MPSASQANEVASSAVDGPVSSQASSAAAVTAVDRTMNTSSQATTSNDTLFNRGNQVSDDAVVTPRLITSQSTAPVLSTKAVTLPTMPTVMTSEADKETRQAETTPSSDVAVSSSATTSVSSATKTASISVMSSAPSSSVGSVASNTVRSVAVSATPSAVATQNAATSNGGATATNGAGNIAPVATPAKNVAMDDGATVQAGVNTAGNDATSHLNDTQFSLNDNTQVLGTILSTIIAIASGIAFKIVRSRKGTHASVDGEFDEEDEQLFDMVAKLKNVIK